MEALESGRFWRCPGCKKLVPTRQESCRCGASRPALALSSQTTATPRDEGGGSSSPSWGWALVAVVATLGGFWMYRTNTRDAADRARLTERVREAHQQPAQQQPAIVLQPPQQALPSSSDNEPTRPLPEPQIPQPVGSPPQVIRIEVPQRQVATQPQPQPFAAAETLDPMKSEPYWQQRLFQSRERVRSTYENCVSQFGRGGLGDVGQTNWASASAALVTAISGQAQLEEDARKAGVPPGWVRFDWSAYPTLRLDSPNAASALKSRHPCSVPDLLKEVRY